MEREGKDKRAVALAIIGKWVVTCICSVDHQHSFNTLYSYLQIPVIPFPQHTLASTHIKDFFVFVYLVRTVPRSTYLGEKTFVHISYSLSQICLLLKYPAIVDFVINQGQPPSIEKNPPWKVIYVSYYVSAAVVSSWKVIYVSSWKVIYVSYYVSTSSFHSI